MTLQSWKTRWRLRRIIAVLHLATDYGLKKSVVDFAESLEATSMMSRGISMKKDAPLTIHCTREGLDTFIVYMTKLHSSKLSLWHRARIGLATLAMSDESALGETPHEFVARELPKAKSRDDDNVIQLPTKH